MCACVVCVSAVVGGGGGGGKGEGGHSGGRNFQSCLQISLRRRKAPGEHPRAASCSTVPDLPPLLLFHRWNYSSPSARNIYFRTTSGANQSADLCEPHTGVTDICEVEEEECIVSL